MNRLTGKEAWERSVKICEKIEADIAASVADIDNWPPPKVIEDEWNKDCVDSTKTPD